MTTTFELFDRSIKVPALAIAASSFATVLALAAITPKAAAHVLAAENFAIGIPTLASLGVLHWLRWCDDARLDALITLVGAILLMFGGYFCINGQMIFFGLFSPRAANLFGSCFGFLFICYILQLLVRLILAKNGN